MRGGVAMTRRSASLTIVLAAAVATTLAAPRSVRAQQPVVVEPPAVDLAPVPAPQTPAELLASADAAVDAGNLQAAAALYDRIAREHAATPEASEARRALKIIAASRTAPPGQLVPDLRAPASSDGAVGVVVRRE